MKPYLFLGLLAFIFLPAFLQGQTKKAGHLKLDTSRVEQRHFDKGRIDQYKEQKEFDYRLMTSEERSWWDRFWDWIWYKFERLMENQGFRTSLNVFLWSLAIGVVVYTIIRIIGMDKVMWLIKGRNQSSLDYVVSEENIYAIDYHNAIREAMMQKEYRLAVRLLFLRTLRNLSDRELIHWKINKTNFDYLQELQSTEFQASFEELAGFYEYAWYGEFPVDESLFVKLHSAFEGFHQKLQA